MNLIALIAAAIGLVVLVILVSLSYKIKPGLLRDITFVVSLVIGLGVAGVMPTLLGDDALATSKTAGEYVLFLGIIALIIKLVFFKKKS